MKEFLQHLCIFTLYKIIINPIIAQEFAENVGLIPKKEPCPCCPICNGKTSVVNCSQTKFGWIWKCKKRWKSKEKGGCNGSVNPSKNSFFENTNLPINYQLAILLCFHWKIGLNFLLKHLSLMDLRQISKQTVCDYYSYCREICDVIASNSQILLGGPNLSVEADETFLTKRKYNRGRITSTHTMTIFGMYCRETKEGLFFHVNGKSKRDLWPIMKKYIHPETKIIYTDMGKQYCNVEVLFSNHTEHKTVNHSKGEFVNKDDKENHINTIENQNKQLKSTIKSRKSLQLIKQYMSVWFYNNTYLSKHQNDCDKLEQWISDVIRVYPGPLTEPLTLKYIDIPSTDEIEHLLPKKKIREDENEDEDNSEDFDWNNLEAF
jgi:hypothetical protein